MGISSQKSKRFVSHHFYSALLTNDALMRRKTSLRFEKFQIKANFKRQPIPLRSLVSKIPS